MPPRINHSKSRFTLLSTLVLLLLFVSLKAEVFYVSPMGNDGNPGSESLPLKTFQGAVDKVKTVLDGRGDIEVYFRGGNYIFETTVVIGCEEDGTANQKITYAAYPGERPVFSSLVKVSGWKRYKGEIMQASLPPGIRHVRYLQDTSENWMNRSTLPYFSTEEKAGGNRGCLECNLGEEDLQEDFSNIQYPQDFAAPDWSKVSQYDIRHASLMWHQEVLPLSHVDIDQRRIFTTIPSCYQMRADREEVDALLRIRNAAHITVQNCTFTKSGGTGIRVDRYGQHIKIVNNSLSYLGRNGIGLLGRGPGYGDVNKNNEIAYNYIARTGMEKWTAIAIVVDQSSNNHIHHNYITNTYFTAMALIGPRQQAFEMNAEGMESFYVGREFHFFEFSKEAVKAAQVNSEEAMVHIYNYGNVIEENAFIDVDEGKGHFLNGKAAYMSGFQKNQKNSFQYNYIYDSFDHSSNDYAFYNDMDQDACDVIGNMINGVQASGNQPETAPLILCFAGWAESDGEATGFTVLRANISINSTFCENDECTHTLGNFTEEGAVKNGEGGSSAYIKYYQKSYETIAPGNITGLPLPGSQEMRAFLDFLIKSF